MNKQLTQRLVLVLLLVFLLIYVICQIQRYIYNPIKVETAYEYTVSHAIAAQGVAVRSEAALPQNATGGELYLAENASRVATEETIIEVLESGAQVKTNFAHAKQLERELKQLLEAQNTPFNYANTEIYSRDIKNQLAEISAMANKGRFPDLADIRNQLTLSLNKKMISSGKEMDFSPRINTIQQELERIEQTMRAQVRNVITAPRAAFFSRNTDGYEQQMTPQKMTDMDIDAYIAWIEGDLSPSAQKKVGKLVYLEKWYFALCIPADSASQINDMLRIAHDAHTELWVDVILNHVQDSIPAYIVEVLSDEAHDQAILILQCNSMNPELIDLRQTEVQVIFRNYTGIHIRSSDIRIRQNEEGVNERGVYILEKHVVRFKRIDPIYEEPEFVLSKTYYLDEQQQEYVRLFDQIITKGTELYDGKPIVDY